MAIEVDTKDCTALGEDEMAEMADLCAETPQAYEVGLLTKHAEEWVLITLVRETGRLKGFAFSTLERIGGTPSVIVGLASVKRTSKRDSVLRAINHDLLRRAVMAFPDEDVLVGTRIVTTGGYEAFRTLHDVVPRPDYKPTGEDRAWGRRLAKRFGIDSASYDEQTFVARGAEVPPPCLSHEALKADRVPEGVEIFFGDLDPDRGDALVVCGWALAEELEKIGR
ncbi:MAG TPA: hypothetical protein VHA73_03480 [Acidimicrobiales bacterium]|jgi:hypothetical protein|nr:hypothetical protein [Acidimicrobiales bacterium]